MPPEFRSDVSGYVARLRTEHVGREVVGDGVNAVEVLCSALRNPHSIADTTSTDRRHLPMEFVSLFLYQFEKQNKAQTRQSTGHVEEVDEDQSPYVAVECMTVLCGQAFDSTAVATGLKTLLRLNVDWETFQVNCNATDPYILTGHDLHSHPSLPYAVGLANGSSGSSTVNKESAAPLCIFRAVSDASVAALEAMYAAIGGLDGVQQDLFLPMTHSSSQRLMYLLPRVRCGNSMYDPSASSAEVGHCRFETDLRPGALDSQWGSMCTADTARAGRVVLLGNLFLQGGASMAPVLAWTLLVDSRLRVWLYQLTNSFFPTNGGRAVALRSAHLSVEYRESASQQIAKALRVTHELFCKVPVVSTPVPLTPSSLSPQPFEVRSSTSQDSDQLLASSSLSLLRPFESRINTSSGERAGDASIQGLSKPQQC